MKKIAILVLFCLVPLVSADVEVTLTVDWALFASPLYTGVVCVENTDLFGEFDTIIMEYSHNDHSGVLSPKDLFFGDQGGNIYCANLEPTHWDFSIPVDTLDNAKITIKNNGYVIFQDDTWSTDVSDDIDDTNHVFNLMQIICVDNDDDGYYADSPTCPAGNDCDDSNLNVYPGAIDLCKGVDDDCDGAVDDGLTQPTANQNGLCLGNTETCLAGAWIPDGTNYAPVAETCDNQDNDCDGVIDEEGATGCNIYSRDGDNDNYGGIYESVIDTLFEGETKAYTLDGGDYGVTVTAITDTGIIVAKFDVNGESTPSLKEGGSTTLSDGANLTVIEIIPNEAGDVTQDSVMFKLYLLENKCLCSAQDPYDAVQGGDCDDTNSLINPGRTDIPQNDIDEDCDGGDAPFINGNESDIKSNGLRNQLKITVNGSEDLTKSFTGIQDIKIMDGDDIIIEFLHNFSLSTLNLNFSINKTNQSNKGCIVIGSLELQENETKIVYFDHLNYSLNTLCIHDAPILSINEISLGCNGIDDFSLYCTAGGNSVTFNWSTYTCYDLGSQYKVDGLKHSGIIEFSYTSPSSDGGTSGGGGGGGGGRVEKACVETWTCTDWSPTACPSTSRQTRTCTDTNNCGTTIDKPNEARICFYYVAPKEKGKEVVEVADEEAPPAIATPPEPTPQAQTPRVQITAAAIIRAYKQEPLTMIILTLFILSIIVWSAPLKVDT